MAEAIGSQTREVVANNTQLAESLINSSREISERIGSGLAGVEFAIDALHADFSYGIGICIQRLGQANTALWSLLEKMDAILKTLDSPTMTKAREFYRLGCDQATKGLYDKALELLLKSESEYDADFFTQYRLGYLYLFGVSDDCNVVDLKRAKDHMLSAHRYARAENQKDGDFSRLAAESLLYASIATYAQVGDDSSPEATATLLTEAKSLALQAAAISPELSQAWFHAAKYSSLLSQQDDCVDNLSRAIMLDKRYALEVHEDKAFEPAIQQIDSFMIQAREDAKEQAEAAHARVLPVLNDLTEWMSDPASKYEEQFAGMQSAFDKIEGELDSGTYFGYREVVDGCMQLESEIESLKSERIEELLEGLRSQVNSINSLGISMSGVESEVVLSEYRRATELFEGISRRLQEEEQPFQSYEAYRKTLIDLTCLETDFLQIGIKGRLNRREVADRRLEEKKREARQQAAEAEAKKVEEKWRSNGVAVGTTLGVIFALGSCIGCLAVADRSSEDHWGYGFWLSLVVLPTVGYFVGMHFGKKRKEEILQRVADENLADKFGK